MTEEPIRTRDNLPSQENVREAAHIIIIGGGIAGNNLAAKLANEGFNPTIIAKKDTDSDVRPSAPLISRRTVERLNLDLEIDDTVNAVRLAGNSDSLLKRIANRRLTRRVGKNGPIAIDIKEVTGILQGRNINNPRISHIAGTFTDVEMDGDRVIGVKYKTDGGDGVLSGDLVVDATGRNAIVAKRVEEKRQGSIEEKEVKRSNQLIGGYIAFNTDEINEFPDLKRTVYLGGLHSKNYALLAPAMPIEGSEATNLILFEGDSERIKDACRSAQESLGSKAALNDVRLEAMRIIAKDTKWEDLMRSVKSIERTVLFSHSEDKARFVDPKLEGLVLVGDSGGYTDPMFGRGIGYGSVDVDKLVAAMSLQDVDSAIADYNLSQVTEGLKRLNWQKKAYKVMSLGGKARKILRMMQGRSGRI